MSECYDARHKLYIELVCTIHRYIARVLRCDARLRKLIVNPFSFVDSKSKPPPVLVDIAPKLGYPPEHRGRFFKLVGDVTNLTNAAIKIGEETQSLVRFICSIKCLPVSAQDGGNTLIEL